MKTDTDDILLTRCKTLIEEKLGWGNSTQWSNRDFEELSQQIFDVTSVTLSPTTLKRIWGKVKYDSAPTATTLNTLAQYTGFENWRDFRQHHAAEMPQEASAVTAAQIQANKPEVRKRPYLFSFILPILLATGIIGWLLLAKKDVNTSAQLNPADYQFSSKKVVASGVPNSVIFDYDASKAPEDSVYIQQSWDSSKRTRVARNQHQHTSIYYYPGFFQAKLVVGRQVIKEHQLFIKTNGWLPLINQEPVPVYFKQQEAIQDGKLGLTVEKIEARHINLQPTAPSVQYMNLKDFGDISTDSFIYETTIQNIYKEGAAVCQYSEIGLLTEGSAILIRLSAKGCISENTLFYIDKEIPGKTNDLSGFGVDFNHFVAVRCEAVNNHVKIYVDNKLAFDFPHKGAGSKIIGLTYQFQGAGLVDAVKLSRGNGQVIYEDTFGR